MLAYNDQWDAEFAGHRVRVRYIDGVSKRIGRVGDGLPNYVLVVVVDGNVGEEVGGVAAAVLPLIHM